MALAFRNQNKKKQQKNTLNVLKWIRMLFHLCNAYWTESQRARETHADNAESGACDEQWNESAAILTFSSTRNLIMKIASPALLEQTMIWHLFCSVMHIHQCNVLLDFVCTWDAHSLACQTLSCTKYRKVIHFIGHTHAAVRWTISLIRIAYRPKILSLHNNHCVRAGETDDLLFKSSWFHWLWGSAL